MYKRQVSPDGIGLKTTLDINSTARYMRGLEPVGNEYLWARERWAEATNQALHDAGLQVRVDHRSYAERGIERESMPRIPAIAREIERRGERSHVAELIREQWHNRQQLGHVQPAPQPSLEKTPVRGPQDMEQIRRQARENWLAMRQRQREQAAGAAPEIASPALGKPGSSMDHGR